MESKRVKNVKKTKFNVYMIVAIAIIAVVCVAGLLLIMTTTGRNIANNGAQPVNNLVNGIVSPPRAVTDTNKNPAPSDSILYLWSDVRSLLSEPSLQNFNIPSMGTVALSDLAGMFEGQTGINPYDITSAQMFIDINGNICVVASGNLDSNAILGKIEELSGSLETTNYGGYEIKSSSSRAQNYVFLDNSHLLVASEQSGSSDYAKKVIDIWEKKRGGLLENKENSDLLNKVEDGLLNGLFIMNDDIKGMMADSLSYYMMELPDLDISDLINNVDAISFGVWSDKSKIVILAKDTDSANNIKSTFDAGMAELKTWWQETSAQYEEDILNDVQLMAFANILNELQESSVSVDGDYVIIEVTMGLSDFADLIELYMTIGGSESSTTSDIGLDEVAAPTQ